MVLFFSNFYLIYLIWPLLGNLKSLLEALSDFFATLSGISPSDSDVVKENGVMGML